MPERCLTFDCQGATLVGILHEPDDAPRGLGVVIVVGGPQYRVGSHRQFVVMARQLAAAGYPVFRFDYRGMGDSDGPPRSFDEVDDDIRAAIDVFHEQAPYLRSFAVFGLCDAASAAMMYCKVDPRVSHLILANPWVRTAEGEARSFVRHYYGRRLFQRAFWAKIWSGDVNFGTSLQSLATKLRRAVTRGPGSPDADPGTGFIDRMRVGLAAFRGPVLLLISGRDLTAHEFDALTRTAPQWAELMSSPTVEKSRFEDADHTFSRTSDLAEAIGVTVAWIVRQGGV